MHCFSLTLYFCWFCWAWPPCTGQGQPFIIKLMSFPVLLNNEDFTYWTVEIRPLCWREEQHVCLCKATVADSMDRADFMVFSTCVVLLIVCLRPLLSEWYDFQTGLESLFFLSGLVGKECVEIRPVSIADGQPTCKQAERRLICVVYNAAVIPSFKNNPTVQAEKPSCKIQYNYWLLPESQSMC